jgi:hypothetical protein
MVRKPNIDASRQIIQEVQPKLVITTGTAGGIGKEFEVGDVIVSPIVRFDCIAQEGAIRGGTLHERGAERDALRQGKVALQGERGATSEGQFAAPEDCPGSPESAAVVCRHDRLLRLRYIKRPL